MSILDMILILLIAVAIFLAIRHMIHQKKQGKSCCGDCSQCSGCHYGGKS